MGIFLTIRIRKKKKKNVLLRMQTRLSTDIHRRSTSNQFGIHF